MFNVPNKRGFNEVVYYLLSVVYPEKSKEAFVWPCLNKKDEMKFRSDVVKFISLIAEVSVIFYYFCLLHFGFHEILKTTFNS